MITLHGKSPPKGLDMGEKLWCENTREKNVTPRNQLNSKQPYYYESKKHVQFSSAGAYSNVSSLFKKNLFFGDIFFCYIKEMTNVKAGSTAKKRTNNLKKVCN